MSETPAPLDAALEELRFDDARALIEVAPEATRERLRERVERAYSETLESAFQLASAISAAARQHEYRVLLDYDEDAATARLLALLPTSTGDRARLHLGGARHWAQRQLESNRRRLEEAEQALAHLDLGLARSIVRRIEDRFLDEAGVRQRDALLLDISARTMEAEELASAAGEILAEQAPPARPWWKRKRER